MGLSRLLLAASSLATLTLSAPVKPRQDSSLYYFAFGDSYTTTSYDPNGEQPSPSNPLGNPGLGQGTVAGGENYVGWLATGSGHNNVLAYDFAVSGATITDSQVPTDPSIHTFEQQVGEWFEPLYTGDRKAWASDNSFFSIFFGINDIGLPLTSEPGSLIDINVRVPALLDAYFGLCERLYNAGARRFMFVSVPPTDRSPYIASLGADKQAVYSDWVNTFNGQLGQRIPQFTASHDGAVAATYDYHQWMQVVLDDAPASGFPDGSCVNGDGVSCIWYNDYHVGSRFNQLLAERMLPAMNSLGFDGSQPVGGYFW